MRSCLVVSIQACLPRLGRPCSPYGRDQCGSPAKPCILCKVSILPEHLMVFVQALLLLACSPLSFAPTSIGPSHPNPGLERSQPSPNPLLGIMLLCPSINDREPMVSGFVRAQMCLLDLAKMLYIHSRLTQPQPVRSPPGFNSCPAGISCTTPAFNSCTSRP